MFKRTLCLLAALCLFSLPVLAETADTFTSASATTDHYGDYALAGDDLEKALNSISGFYLVCTTNPDGSANAAFAIFGAVQHEGKLYLQMGFAENQTKANILANKKGLAVYAANPGTAEGDKPYAVSGARMSFQLVEDEELIKTLQGDSKRPAIFVEVVNTLPLG